MQGLINDVRKLNVHMIDAHGFDLIRYELVNISLDGNQQVTFLNVLVFINTCVNTSFAMMMDSGKPSIFGSLSKH